MPADTQPVDPIQAYAKTKAEDARTSPMPADNTGERPAGYEGGTSSNAGVASKAAWWARQQAKKQAVEYGASGANAVQKHPAEPPGRPPRAAPNTQPAVPPAGGPSLDQGTEPGNPVLTDKTAGLPPLGDVERFHYELAVKLGQLEAANAALSRWQKRAEGVGRAATGQQAISRSNFARGPGRFLPDPKQEAAKRRESNRQTDQAKTRRQTQTIDKRAANPGRSSLWNQLQDGVIRNVLGKPAQSKPTMRHGGYLATQFVRNNAPEQLPALKAWERNRQPGDELTQRTLERIITQGGSKQGADKRAGRGLGQYSADIESAGGPYKQVANRSTVGARQLTTSAPPKQTTVHQPKLELDEEQKAAQWARQAAHQKQASDLRTPKGTPITPEQRNHFIKAFGVDLATGQSQWPGGVVRYPDGTPVKQASNMAQMPPSVFHSQNARPAGSLQGGAASQNREGAFGGTRGRTNQQEAATAGPTHGTAQGDAMPKQQGGSDYYNDQQEQGVAFGEVS